MLPRQRPDPDRIGVTPEAFEELSSLGSQNETKPAAADVYLFWCDVRKFGLPAHLEHKRLFTLTSGKQAGDWRLYVERISGLRMAIAESSDGRALWWLLVQPSKTASLKAVIEVALNRAR